MDAILFHKPSVAICGINTIFIMMKQYVNIAWYVKHIPYIPYTDMTLYVKHRVTDGVGISHGVNECVYIGTKVTRVSENI